jgi:hypothetical protein
MGSEIHFLACSFLKKPSFSVVSHIQQWNYIIMRQYSKSLTEKIREIYLKQKSDDGIYCHAWCNTPKYKSKSCLTNLLDMLTFGCNLFKNKYKRWIIYYLNNATMHGYKYMKVDTI